tara:strand:- start:342 stop:539 length:198 start_codon:yes stop_codon:yes gene_type:complete
MLPSDEASFWNMYLNPFLRFLKGMNLEKKEKNIPEPTSKKINHGPHASETNKLVISAKFISNGRV